ncbi:tRNA glutamyl-Q(34) synthetase GluQRS [Rhodobacterales bacterium HKCCE2091]|nr:tRNA glutamyl-Q(34) synthetase GluQRS [Rhodobacterales bacterium HKCCE2091]
MTVVTRFAPSPTGPLHLGHAFSAITAHDLARARDGTFILRFDDIDRERSKPAYERMALEDLAWLGLTWPEPVLRQHTSAPHLDAALGRLSDLGLTYPCSCTRADIAAAAGAPQEGVPTHGPDGRIYPGTCRGRPMAEATPDDAIRFDMAKALDAAAPLPGWIETGPERPGTYPLSRDAMLRDIGDVVIRRRGGGAAYHLSVVVDDTRQGITHVTRGLDLMDTTPIHVLLAHLLGAPIPAYYHHRLIRDETGKRLAKRDDARAIRRYRDEGATPDDIRRMVGLPPRGPEGP